MGRLFRLGDDARAALEDGDQPVREAVTELREVVAELRSRAGDYLDGIGASLRPHLDDVERTLTAAAVDPEGRSPVASGMLTRPLPASGFGAVSGLELATAAADGRGGDRHGDDHLRQQRERLAQEVERRRERYEEARRRADDLRGRAEQAERRADELEQELTDMEGRLEELAEPRGGRR